MIPEKIGRYVIKEKLGQGGMATVYRALDPRFKRDVAIKILPTAYLNNATFLARFEREAQVIASLEYPGIVPVYDFGEENGQPYLVMRYMPGGSLADRIGKGPLRLEEVVRIFLRLAPALDHFHAQGIVHRDLKPGNILFDQYDTACISDFGIARLSEGTVSLTGESLIGTPAYMSPEQAQGLRELDGRSDLYALGAILFETLTGKQPYEATTPMGVILKHITEPAPRLQSVKADLPVELEGVIERSMEKDRDHRYPTATAMAADLSAILEERTAGVPGEAIKPHAIETPGKRITWPSPGNNVPPAQAHPPAGNTPKDAKPSPLLEKESVPPPAKEARGQTGPGKPVQQAEPQKFPVVPPFILPEAEPTPPVKSAISKSIEAKSEPRPVVKPGRKISPAWIAGGILVAAVACVLILAGGWILSALFATPTEDYANLSDTPPADSGANLESAPSVTDTVESWEYFDDFSDPNSGWWAYEGEEGIMGYQSDSFQIQVNIPNWYLINNPGYSAVDTSIEVDAYKSGGPDENLFGIICRYQDPTKFYFFVIGSSGYYGIGKVLNGEPTLITTDENAFSYAINQGRTSNALRADCVGNSLTLYVNDTKLTEGADDEFADGEVGLFVGTFDIHGVNILFDNFRVTEFIRP